MEKPDDLGLAVIARAWADDSFRAELINDPRTALQTHFDVELPNGVEVVVHEDDAKTMNFVLPQRPRTMDSAGQELKRLSSSGALRALGRDAAPLTGSATSNYVSCCRPV